MHIEFEAVFSPIDVVEVRHKLREAHATLVQPEFLQCSQVFFPPASAQLSNSWIRVREEANHITLSLKEKQEGEHIETQKEIEITINDRTKGKAFLEKIGCICKADHQKKREIWHLRACEVVIDTWPYLEPFIEIEGPDEASVKEVARILGFSWSDARFHAVDQLYHESYGTPHQVINNETPIIHFDAPNPFLSSL
ncbi:CYTH domain-containing protein [Candidatus Peribacteria bacterium]|nr:CYTH domain-containing protein [Candidatus Peribacteria bacterium]